MLRHTRTFDEGSNSADKVVACGIQMYFDTKRRKPCRTVRLG